MKKPETLFKDKVIRDLRKLRHAWFVKTQEVSTRGIPDILMCLSGRFVAIELKKDDKEKPEALQQYHLTRIMQRAKGVSLVAYPENWETLYAYIKTLDTPYS